MAKNRHNKGNESGKQAAKAGQNPSAKKLNGDRKPKKAKEKADHLEHIPFRLREIMKSKDRMKMGSQKAKKNKAALALKCKPEDAEVGDIAVPHFKRGKAESEKAYVRRMENETKHVLFLTNNQVERKPELEEEKQEKPAEKGKSEKKREYDKVRLQRLKQKKMDRREEKMEQEMFIDKVDFGDVAMAPPSLSTLPRKAPVKTKNASRGLLLNSLLGHSPAATAAKPSMARQRIMEEERVRAVEAYRHLKKQKQQQRENRAAGLEKLKNL
ncbi:coiled-coil domain-containing protein 137-like [Diretmus argenteus]